MEPPAKRLRINKSVAVDETDPDYIAAKAKQKAQLKDRFESIFSKFEAMPEAMTDEIDMRTGEVVVDRGHTRRLNRAYKQRLRRGPGQLVDDLFPNELDELSDHEEGVGGGTRDELAPSQSPEPGDRMQDGSYLECAQTPRHATQPKPPQKSQPKRADIPPPYTPANASIHATTQLSSPTAASHAANWMQLVQFPQTPAGQLAQTAFMTQITQAVQQAITPLISNMLSSMPGVPAQGAGASAAFMPPTPVPHNVTPATEPILRSPSPREISDIYTAPQSSPISASGRLSRPRGSLAKQAPFNSAHIERTSKKARLEPREELDPHTITPQRPRRTDSDDVSSRRNDSSTNILNTLVRSNARSRKYAFSEADDLHIIEQKMILKRSWDEIKSSRTEWNNWPLYALHNHWNLRLKHWALMDPEDSSLESNKTQRALSFPSSDVLETGSTPTSQHLPTPSSLEHDEAEGIVEDPQGAAPSELDDLLASGGHFDQDEQELLSLAGADDPVEERHEDTPMQDLSDDVDDMYEPDDVREELQPADFVLPSVEYHTDSDDIPLVGPILAQIDINESRAKPEVPPTMTITSKPVLSPNKSREKPPPISFRVDSDSEDDLDRVGADSPSMKTSMKTSMNPSKIPQARRRKQRNMINPHTSTRSISNTTAASSLSPLRPTAEDDELLAPATPIFKRETCTPPPNLLLATSTLRTPGSAPQPTTLKSSGAKPADKLARSAFLNKVKRSWAKNGRRTNLAHKTVANRSSFGPVPRKRAWVDEGDSADDLAV